MDPLDALSTPARQTRTLEETAHRPWPVRERPWAMAQTWDDLLFAHWRVPAETLRPLVPAELTLDERDGSAWVGVTPFRITGLRLRATPPLPYVSTFLELNVRTYVTAGAKPGILFFSLDAESALAVQAARRFYRLPYFLATMRASRDGDAVRYESARRGSPPGEFAFRGTYRPAGPRFEAAKGSLEYFLAERYCLYTVEDGALLRGEIHHKPWPLQPASLDLELNTMPPPGVDPGAEEPLLHYAHRQDVLIWPLERVPGEERRPSP